MEGWNPEPSKYSEISGLLPHYIPMPEIFNQFNELNIESKSVSMGSPYMLTRCTNPDETDWKKREYEPIIGKELGDILAQTDGFSYWYNWCSKFWGTKWGDYQGYTDYTPGDDYILYDHSSAWGPLNEGWLGLSEIFPTLQFSLEFHEEGMNFRGTFECQAGKSSIDKDWEMKGPDYMDLFDQTEDQHMHGEEYCDDKGVYLGDEFAAKYDEECKAKWDKRAAERKIAEAAAK